MADICMWGITTTNGITYNGNYLSIPGDPQINSNSYWKLDRNGENCGSDYYYIYYNSGRWRIGIDFTTNYGFCDDEGFDHPQNCPGWTFGSESDSGATVTVGDCPTIDCGNITVTSTKGSNQNCKDGAEQIAQNVYSTTDRPGYIWFFNEPTFRWKCVTTTEYDDYNYSTDTCAVSTNSNGYSQTSAEWQDMDASTTTTFDFVATSGTSTYDIQITCANGGMEFTKSPTSPNPTQAVIPTPNPTYMTVDDPTASPSDATPSPTNNPTDENPTTAQGTPSPSVDFGEISTTETDASPQSNINYIITFMIVALCLSVFIV